jgi:hypothetical protein
VVGFLWKNLPGYHLFFAMCIEKLLKFYILLSVNYIEYSRNCVASKKLNYSTVGGKV